MSSQWQQFEQKFNAMTLRERLLIGITTLVLLGYGWWALFAESNHAEIERLGAENKSLMAESARLAQTAITLQDALKKGVKNKKKERLIHLKNKLNEIEQQLKQKTVELIDPDEMFRVLSQLVYKTSNLKLLSLARVSVTEAMPKEKNAQKTDKSSVAVTIYRHTMQISLAGKFADIVEYMTQLETMDWKLIWDSLVIEQMEKEHLKLTIHLSTLSDKASWVGI